MLLKKLYSFCFCCLLLQNLWGQQPRLVLPIGHTATASFASFSPDGKRILSAAEDKTVKVWDVTTGFLLTDLRGHSSYINAAQFSNDGKEIMTASADRSLKIWDIASEKIIDSFTSEEGIGTATYLAKSKKIIVAEKELMIFSTHPLKVIDTLAGHTERVYFINFSADSSKIITASEDHTAKVWDVASRKMVLDLKGHTEEVLFAQFSPDGKKILTTSKDNHIKIWNAVTGSLLLTINTGKGGIQTACFSLDGKRILQASYRSVKMWNAATALLIKTLYDGPEGLIRFAYFSPGDKTIISSSDININTWDGVSYKLIKKSTIHNDDVVSAIFSPGGQNILTTSKDGLVKISDPVTGKELQRFASHSRQIEIFANTTQADYFLSSYTDSTARLWNTKKEGLLHSLDFTLSPEEIIKYARSEQEKYRMGWSKGEVKAAQFSGSGLLLATVQQSFNSLIVWNTLTGQKVQVFNRNRTDGLYGVMCFSPDDKLLSAATLDSTFKMWQLSDGNLLNEFKGHHKAISAAAFSSDGKKIATGSFDNTVKIWDVASGASLISFNQNTEIPRAVSFTDNDKQLITVSHGGVVQLWNLEKGAVVQKFTIKSSEIRSLFFSKDNKYMINCDWQNAVWFWNIATGISEKRIKLGDNDLIQSVLPEQNLVIAKDGSQVKIFELDKGKLLYSFFAVDNTDFFTQLSTGYYFCTPGAAKLLHYVTNDLKIITFEQLDVKYNRPDKVLEAIGNTDTALIKSYQKAWEKRIKKLGIDTTAFRDGYSVPEADFVDRNVIEHEQKNGTLKLHIKGIDSAYKLDRFNIWVNEAPLFGQRGFNIRKRNKNDFDTTIAINLSQGENRIETSITNVNGTESYRMPLTVNYTPAVKQKEMTRFIGIGIDQFMDSKYNLQYSSKDIRDLSVKLKQKYGDDIVIDTLFNENVTISNVKALKQKLLQTTENDKVIIAFSGHGMLSKDYDYYLSTYSVNFDKPEQNGLPYDELESLLDSIPARKKLMLIDACHSGEVDKEDLVTLDGSSDSLIKGFKPVAYNNEGHLGLKNSFELMQSLFVNVGKSTGATIISAAAGTQFALERNDLKNGVFTYSILEAMNKFPTMKISELKKIVGERVEQLTKGLQKPTSRNETIAVDWNVW